MDYAQERVTTLHALQDHTPAAPTDQAAVVVPMAEREYGSLATEQILSELEAVDPARVVVPLRASGIVSSRFVSGSTGMILLSRSYGVTALG
jgi:hypothetical protein